MKEEILKGKKLHITDENQKLETVENILNYDVDLKHLLPFSKYKLTIFINRNNFIRIWAQIS